MSDDEFNSDPEVVRHFFGRKVAGLERENADLRARLEIALAELHGMQDGAILRDTKARLERAEARCSELLEIMQEAKEDFHGRSVLFSSRYLLAIEGANGQL